MDNQISNYVVAEDAVHTVGGWSHMLFPSNAEAKLTSYNHFISTAYFVFFLITSWTLVKCLNRWKLEVLAFPFGV